jgi:hypothetical protein
MSALRITTRSRRHRYADEFFNASTIDIDAVTAAAKRFRPDGIMTLATDMPMRAVAAAAAALGYPDFAETAIKATDKGEMIKALKKHKVESPWYNIINHRMNWVRLVSS